MESEPKSTEACFQDGEITNILVTESSMIMTDVRLYLAVIIKSNSVMVTEVVSNSTEIKDPLTEAMDPMTIAILRPHMSETLTEDPMMTRMEDPIIAIPQEISIALQ